MIADEISDYVVRTKFEHLPRAVVEQAKLILLDTIGCILGGAQLEIGRQIIALSTQMLHGKQATLIGCRNRTGYLEAVFANAFLSDILDYEDSTLDPVAHFSAEIIPAALAVGELKKAAGKDLLTAIVVGYEVGIRIGSAISYSADLSRRRQGTSFATFQILAATVTAGKLLGLSKEEMANALGTAATVTMMPGAKLVSSTTSYMSKSVEPAASARNAVTAAMLARHGLDAPHDFLEVDSEHAFWARYRSDRCNFERMTEKLGQEWAILRTEFKPFPSCRWTHAPATAALNIMRSEKVNPQDIEEIIIESHYGAVKGVLGALGNKKPRNMAEATFSTPYAVATILLGVPPGPLWYAQETLKRQDVRDLLEKVELIEDPKATEVFPIKHRGRATILLKGGRSLVGQTEYMKGSPENAMSKEELVGKFKALSDAFLTQDDATRICEMIFDLDNVGSINQITEDIRHLKEGANSN